MEKIKEKLLLASFLCTNCVIKANKENSNVSLFHSSIQSNYAQRANRKKCSWEDFFFQGSSLKFSQLLYICFSSANNTLEMNWQKGKYTINNILL